MWEWSDARVFLAVARAGTSAGAARVLALSQPTVVRRIAALEAALGLAFFHRYQSGYALTEAGAALVPLAEQMEAAAKQLADTASGHARRGRSVIRLTGPETLVNEHLMPILAPFRKRFPFVQLDLISSDARLDIGAGEADVALRAGSTPDDDLVGRRLPDIAWNVYASRNYIDQHGIPADRSELNDHVVIGGEGGFADVLPLRWLAQVAPRAAVSWRANTLSSLMAAARAGLGLTTLPCFHAEVDASLVRCFPRVPELDSPFWVVARRDIAREAPVKALTEMIHARMMTHKALIAGEPLGQG